MLGREEQMVTKLSSWIIKGGLSHDRQESFARIISL